MLIARDRLAQNGIWLCRVGAWNGDRPFTQHCNLVDSATLTLTQDGLQERGNHLHISPRMWSKESLTAWVKVEG
jgi:hypothetical protein